MIFRARSGSLALSPPRHLCGSRKATDALNAFSVLSKSNCCGFGASAIWPSFALQYLSFAIATTSTGSFTASDIAPQLRRGANSLLKYQSRHDSMDQLTPSNLSNRPGPIQAMLPAPPRQQLKRTDSP